jgi:twitching motility two-component system response regulator PilG
MASDHDLLEDMTVLVIDDDHKSLRATQLVLQRLGASVIIASDGANGLTRATDTRPDIICAALRLPLLDGWRLLEVLREDTDLKTVPVVAFTSRADPVERNKAREAGFADYIEKPFTPAQITRVIKAIVAAS